MKLASAFILSRLGYYSDVPVSVLLSTVALCIAVRPECNWSVCLRSSPKRPQSHQLFSNSVSRYSTSISNAILPSVLMSLTQQDYAVFPRSIDGRARSARSTDFCIPWTPTTGTNSVKDSRRSLRADVEWVKILKSLLPSTRLGMSWVCSEGSWTDSNESLLALILNKFVRLFISQLHSRKRITNKFDTFSIIRSAA